MITNRGLQSTLDLIYAFISLSKKILSNLDLGKGMHNSI